MINILIIAYRKIKISQNHITKKDHLFKTENDRVFVSFLSLWSLQIAYSFHNERYTFSKFIDFKWFQ